MIMKKKPTIYMWYKLGIAFALFAIGVNTAAIATTWTTIGAGAVTSLSNWTNGTASPTTFATPGDTWIVVHNMSFPSGSHWKLGTVGGAVATLDIQAGGRINCGGSGSDTISVYGNMIIASGAAVMLNYSALTGVHSLNVSGNLTVTGGSFKQMGGNKFNVLIGGNLAITSGKFGKVSGSVPGSFNLDVAGNATFSGDTLFFKHAKAEIHGLFTMNSGVLIDENGPMRLVTHGDFLLNGGLITMRADDTIQVGANYTMGGGRLVRDIGSRLTLKVLGNATINSDTIRVSGTGVECTIDIAGDCTINGGGIKLSGTVVDAYINVGGNYMMTGGEVIVGGTSAGLLIDVAGNYTMTGGNMGGYYGGGARIYSRIRGNCSLSGTCTFTNSSGATNEIHMASLPGAPSMLMSNTSTGIWSKTNVIIDTNSSATLSGIFNTSTGTAATHGVHVWGTLICPSASLLTGTGTFRVYATGTLLVASPLGVNGHVTTTGTISLDTRANYVYNGTSAQVTGTYLPAALVMPGQFIINNASGVTLSQNTNTTGTLVLSNGILHTGSFTMTVPGAAGTVTGAGTNRFVEGTLIKSIAGMTTVNYETGATSYAPVQLALSGAGTTGSIGVKCVAGSHPSLSTSGILSTNMVNQYWTLSNYAAAGPSAVTPTFTYEAGSIAGGSNAGFKIQKYAGTSWLSAALSTTNTASPYTSTPTAGIALSSLPGSYVAGNSCGTPITGVTTICAAGATTTLSNATPGGTWSSGATSIATVGGTGVVTAVSSGTAVIFYITPACSVSAVVQVGVPPISGPASVCPGNTMVLTNAMTGGVWSSSSATIATVSASGVVTGVSGGTAIISYTAGGCPPATHVVSVASLAAITGSPNVFAGATTTLSCASPGGTWSSSNPVVASVSGTGVVAGHMIGTSSISYAVGTCASTFVVYVDYDYLILIDSVVNPTDTTCNTPKFFVRVNGASPLLRLKTLYGDGTRDSTLMTATGAISNQLKAHAYGCSGNHTVKHVAYVNNVPKDSIAFTYVHSACNNLPVKLYFDANGNCSKNMGEPLNFSPMLVKIDSAGVPLDTVSVLAGLNYKAYGPVGTVYTFRVLPGASFYASCPSTGAVNFTITSGTGSYPVQYFGLSCGSSSSCDVEINSAIPVTAANTIRGNLYVRNNECTPTDATVTLHYSPLYTGYFSAMPTPSSAGGGVATWTLSGLSAATGMKTINFRGNAVSGAYLTIGSTIHETGIANPIIIDSDTSNNQMDETDTVTGPYDPNMVEVSPAGCFTDADTLFRYAIHFENMGNDTAHNIYIMDTLSPFVDLNHLSLVVSSADMMYAVVENNAYKVVRFDFPNIDLPDSSHHGLSDGSVTFDIPMLTSLPDGTIVTNRAGIYFDYADVVMTNIAATVKGCPTTKVQPVVYGDDIRLYPNPATNKLTVVSTRAIKEISVANILGQTIYTESFDTKETSLDVSTLMPGVYLLKVNGSEIKKFVKE